METVKIFIIGFALVITTAVIMAAVLGQTAVQPRTAYNTQGPSGDVQIVNVRMSGSQYILSPAVVKAGTTVRLVADMNSVTGCMRTMVIPSLGVRKTLSTSDNTIEFTPATAGTFSITCGMGMGQGTLQVSNDAGAVPAAQAAAPITTGSTCGAAGGGCGCGR